MFVVQPESNRVGIRLRAEDGAVALLAPGSRRASSTPRAWSRGPCRCRPDGDPVVLLPDHATLGGYPVVAVVATADHGLLGQCAPGHARAPRADRRSTRRDEARRLRRARRAAGAAVVGHYPLAVD